MTRAATKPRLATLREDDRLRSLVALTDEPLVYSTGESDGVAVIYKHPRMAKSLGDLPWHRDCNMGGHATMCPTEITSVFLNEASPKSDTLAFLPRSRHLAFNAHDP